jgi:hypothetical protein
MVMKSALDDFRGRSLRAVSGLMRKLDYVASLREPDGTYSHWGLARVYGADAAQGAVSEAHRGIVTTILRTPFSKLLQDTQESMASGKNESAELIAGWNRQKSRLMPPHAGPGTERHLSSVLSALSSLLEHQR